MIEKAIRDALLASAAVTELVGTQVMPGIAPEHVDGAHVVYGQVGASEEGAFDVTTHEVVFEFDLVPPNGLGSGRYLDAKALAIAVHEALRHGFRSSELCVYHSKRTALTDRFSSENQQHWVEAAYRFTYDTREI